MFAPESGNVLDAPLGKGAPAFCVDAGVSIAPTRRSAQHRYR